MKNKLLVCYTLRFGEYGSSVMLVSSWYYLSNPQSHWNENKGDIAGRQDRVNLQLLVYVFKISVPKYRSSPLASENLCSPNFSCHTDKKSKDKKQNK